MEQVNPIFKFLSENKLTSLDEKSFLDKYSRPEKAKEIHSFMVQNELTSLSENDFFDKYLKKKEPAILGPLSPEKPLPQPGSPSPEKPLPQPGVKPKVGFPTSPSEAMDLSTRLGSTSQEEVQVIKEVDKNLIRNFEDANRRVKDFNSTSGMRDVDPSITDKELLSLTPEKYKKRLETNAINATKTASPHIEELANRLVKSKGSDFFDPIKKVANVERIDQFSRNVARSFGLPETGYFYNQLKTKIESKVVYNDIISSPDFNENFKNIYKKNTGKEFVDPELKYKQSESVIASTLIRKKIIEDEITKDASKEIETFSEESFLPESRKINESYKLSVDQLKKQAQEDPEAAEISRKMYQDRYNELKEAVANNQISADLANQMLNSKELNDKISSSVNEFLNKKYKPAFDKAFQEYSFQRTSAINKMLSIQNQVNSKANERFKRQMAELRAEADLKLKDLNVSKEESEYIKNSWKEAFDVTAKERNIQKGLTEDAISAGVPGHVFFKSTISSFGRMIKSTAEAFDFPDIALYGKIIEQDWKPADNPTEKFADLFDPSKLSRLSGNIFGSMIPSVTVGASVAVATRGSNLPLAGRIAVTGLSGFISETPSIVGEAYSETLSRTGLESEAKKASDRAFNSQLIVLPMYMLDGVKFFPSVLKKAPVLGKTLGGRVVVGASTEYITELAQEYPQTLFESAYMNNKDLSEAFNSKWLETLSNTALQVAPVILMGGSSPIISSGYYAIKVPIDKRRGRSFASANDLSELLPEQKSQFFARLSLEKSPAFTNAVLSTMLSTGSITQQEFDDIAPFVANAEENQKIIYQAAKKGANASNQLFLATLLSEQNKLVIQAQEDPSLQPQLDELNKRIEAISSGLNEDLYVVIYQDGSSFSFDKKRFDNVMSDQKFIDKIKNNEIKVFFDFKEKKQRDSQIASFIESVYGIKAPVIQESAPSVSDKKIDKEQQKELDQKVEDFQSRTGYKPDELMVDTMTGVTIDRLSMGIPVDSVALSEASDSLYRMYKQYENMLNSTSRLMTTSQITKLMSELEDLITKIENVKNGEDFNSQVEEKSEILSEESNITEQPVVEPKTYKESVKTKDLEGGYGEDTVEGIVGGQYYQDVIASAKTEGVSSKQVLKDMLKSGALDNIESMEDLDFIEGQIKQDLGESSGAKPSVEAEPMEDFIEANYRQIMADLKLKNRVSTSGCGY